MTAIVFGDGAVRQPASLAKVGAIHIAMKNREPRTVGGDAPRGQLQTLRRTKLVDRIGFPILRPEIHIAKIRCETPPGNTLCEAKHISPDG